MDIKIIDNNKMKKFKAPSHNTPQTIHFFTHIMGKNSIMNQRQFVVPNGHEFEYISSKNIVQDASGAILNSNLIKHTC
jgi:hypothetical protein